MKLTLSRILKKYGERTILSECSYVFARNRTYVLMGPNGCGKSTLLRICSLLEEPDSGEIEYSSHGAPLRKDNALKRRMTLVLPRIGLFNTTVFRNAAYGLEIRSVGKSEIRKRTMRSLAFVGLEEKANQDALTLSSGEMQRLGMARAIALDPEYLFLDEPTASTDEQNTAIIESIISTMKKESRTTVIMTTHDRAQAERLADCLLLLRNGCLEEA